MKKISAFLILVLSGSGCASIPRDAPGYTPAPEASHGNGVLYIYRQGAYPVMRTPTVLVDGKEIFDPPEKAYTWIYLPEGNHRVTIDWSWDTGWPDLSFELPIESGKSHFLKLSGSFEYLGGSWETKWEAGSIAADIPPAEAERELRSCCKYIEAANK